MTNNTGGGVKDIMKDYQKPSDYKELMEVALSGLPDDEREAVLQQVMSTWEAMLRWKTRCLNVMVDNYVLKEKYDK